MLTTWWRGSRQGLASPENARERPRGEQTTAASREVETACLPPKWARTSLSPWLLPIIVGR